MDPVDQPQHETEAPCHWIIPYCTWHIMIQYVRLICEHSGIPSGIPPYHLTRTTVPSLWERILIIPRNIGYHYEHHWYSSVPFYNLPKLRTALTRDTRFGLCGAISLSVSARCASAAVREPPITYCIHFHPPPSAL